MKTRQIRPVRIYETVTAELKTHVLPRYKGTEPPWYKALYSIPPSETRTRSVPVRHHAPDPNLKRPRRSFRPQQITFPEDRLRDIFFRDHPWELARPRVLVEQDGKDYQTCDWSKGIRQPGVALSGECVVQRQLWLMEHSGLQQDQAYDQARREFYALRQEEEIERRVAREEARYVGAYFGQSRLEIGMGLEDAMFEKWKQWGYKQVESRAMADQQDDIDFGAEKEVEAEPEPEASPS